MAQPARDKTGSQAARSARRPASGCGVIASWRQDFDLAVSFHRQDRHLAATSIDRMIRQESLQRREKLPRQRLVVPAARDRQKLLRLVGLREEPLAVRI